MSGIAKPYGLINHMVLQLQPRRAGSKGSPVSALRAHQADLLASQSAELSATNERGPLQYQGAHGQPGPRQQRGGNYGQQRVPPEVMHRVRPEDRQQDHHQRVGATALRSFRREVSAPLHLNQVQLWGPYETGLHGRRGCRALLRVRMREDAHRALRPVDVRHLLQRQGGVRALTERAGLRSEWPQLRGVCLERAVRSRPVLRASAGTRRGLRGRRIGGRRGCGCRPSRFGRARCGADDGRLRGNAGEVRGCLRRREDQHRALPKLLQRLRPRRSVQRHGLRAASF